MGLKMKVHRVKGKDGFMENNISRKKNRIRIKKNIRSGPRIKLGPVWTK